MAENMPRIRKSIIVGIGGTGASVVLYAKRALMQFYGKIPYAISFLALDTDNRRPLPLRVSIKGERYEWVTLEDDEYLYLSVDDPLNVIRIAPAIKKWWPAGLPVRAILNGAGGFRSRGRLAFHAHADRVEAIIKRVVNKVVSDQLAHNMRQQQKLQLMEGAVDVYVVSSLAGGTGSGSFIDAGFLFQRALEGFKHRVTGFFILPSVFEELPATLRVKMNGYAALKELNYYFEIDYLSRKPSFTFGDRTFQPTRPPYDVVNLIDAIHESGEVIPGKGTESGVENLCRILGEGVAINLGNVGQKAESACDNLFDHIVGQNPNEWGGKRPHYSTIGVSSIIYPMEKHFNQLSTYYAYALIDGLLGMVKEGKETGPEMNVEEDINKFLTEAGLGKEQILENILASQNLRFSLSAEGIDSQSELDQEVAAARKRGDSLKAQMEQNQKEKMIECKEKINQFLAKQEGTLGVIYTRRASEKIAARFKVFRDEMLPGIDDMEKRMSSNRKMAQEFYEESVKRVGWKERILRRKGQIFQDYLDRMGGIVEIELRDQRHRKALSVFTALTETIEDYLKQLGLGIIEKKLSEVRQKIEEDYFGTSKLIEQYGQFSLILYPKEVFVDRKPGTKPGASDREIILLPVDFEKLNVPAPDSKEFLDQSKLTVSNLERVDPEDLKKRIMAHSHEKVSPVKKIGVEKMLPFREEGIGYWLREASRRAFPLWHHNATAHLAAQMVEIFIIGVGDEHDTEIKKLSFPEAKFPPTFMSTSDPYKIFLFKYKAPLPAHLLADMERYRLIYLESAIEGTPHVEDRAELMLPDLFPESRVDEQSFRLYVLAMALGSIREEQIEARFLIDDVRCLKPGEEPIELGYPAWRVLEELKRDERKDLRSSLESLLKQESKKKPDQVKQSLDYYYQKVKQAFDERKPAMTLGDEILLHRQRRFLDEFFRNGADLGKLFL